jgi:hypothetical protein
MGGGETLFFYIVLHSNVSIPYYYNAQSIGEKWLGKLKSYTMRIDLYQY